MSKFEGRPPKIETPVATERVVEELELAFAEYERKHDLAALNAIRELTPAEAERHPIREPARLALEGIVQGLNILAQDKSVSDDQWNALCDRYILLSRAVGMINKNVVDHGRAQRPRRIPWE